MKISKTKHNTSFFTSLSLCIVMLLSIIVLFQNCGGQKFTGAATSASTTGDQDGSGNPTNPDDDPNTPDTKAPSVEIVSGPNDYENVASATMRFEASDNRGIDSFKCKLDSLPTKLCKKSVSYANLSEGSHIFEVVALDTSGNPSEPDQVAWTVDTIKPTVSFIAPLQSSSTTQTSAQFYFEGKDNGGTGISGYECQFDGGAIYACSSPAIVPNVTLGSHIFAVRAFDKALNPSDVKTYNWQVNQVDASGPGDFQILGVSGTGDSTIDSWLSEDVSPKISWGSSSSATNYNVSILNSSSQVVCAAANTTSLSYTFNTACRLADNASYIAKVISTKGSNNSTLSKLYNFNTDFSPPTVSISAPVLNSANGGASTTLNFNVADSISGLSDVVCYRTYNSAVTSYPCLNKSTLDLTNLGIGSHSFYIKATDKVGHEVTSSIVSWNVQAVVCDPFSASNSGLCKKGLQGHIYYVSAAERAKGDTYIRNTYTNVSSIITKGIKSNTSIIFSQLNYPTVNFTQGFTAGNYVVKDDAGNKLDEWFAFRLDTILKLKASDLPAGKTSQEYEIAILSDDGTLVSFGPQQQVGTASTGNLSLVINNDGTHPTQMGCISTSNASRRINFDINTRLPVRIDYYQGPRTHIALRLIWRKVTSTTAPDAYCGSSGSGSEGLGTSTYWTQMVNRGWTDLTPDNYMTEETN